MVSKTAKDYPGMDLKRWSQLGLGSEEHRKAFGEEFQPRGTSQKKLWYAASCALGASHFPRSSCTPVEQSSRSHSPRSPTSLRPAFPSSSLQHSAGKVSSPISYAPPTFRGTSALLRSPGKALLTLDPNCGFACRCCSFTSVPSTHSNSLLHRLL